MNQFSSIKKLDQAILYMLELASSLSIILLAFGLIASMANVLTKGSVLTDHIIMQYIWAWTQCIAIDASVAGTIIRTHQSFVERSWAKCILYTLLSCLLLFTAAIVSNIESVQQTLNIALDKAYSHVFVPVEALIWIRSVVIVLLIVAHALRHVQPQHPSKEETTPFTAATTPELLNELRTLLLTSTNVTQEPLETLPIEGETITKDQQEAPQAALLPTVTEEERNKVIEAFTNGIPRREICAHLHWGSTKYTTIVKPVLDAYSNQEQQTGNIEKQV